MMPMPWPRQGPDRVPRPRTARSSPTIRRIRRSRMLGWDRNPLRRRIDRVEAAAAAGLIAVFLISAPVLGAAAGHWSNSAAMREQRAEMAWRLVPATVQDNAQIPSGPAGHGLDDGTLDGAGWAGAPRLDFGHPGRRCGRQRPGVGHPVGLADLAAAPALTGTSACRTGRMAGSARAGTSALPCRRRGASPVRPASPR
jgi:hypothetical protein